MDIIRLSGFAYCHDDITSMETQILDKIEWRLHPPTAIAFVRLFCYRFRISCISIELFIERAQFLLELSVCGKNYWSIDYYESFYNKMLINNFVLV